jgi:hypothetical protein
MPLHLLGTRGSIGSRTIRLALFLQLPLVRFPVQQLTRMTSTWNAPTPWTPNAYPKARRGDHVDIYKSKRHGDVHVHDPYQWLEANSEETTAWVEGVLSDTLVKKRLMALLFFCDIKAQAAFTQEYLQKNPELERLKKEMFKNVDYPKARQYNNTTSSELTLSFLSVFGAYSQR